MQLNIAQREVNLKIVFYGPPLSGKTTNLQSLHKLLSPDVRGRLTILDTVDDRTLFFDLLPITLVTVSGYRIRMPVYTVPGQVLHASTDGLIFIADAQEDQSKNNNLFWGGMKKHLTEYGMNPDEIPTVIQFNKIDLPNTRTEAELEEVRKKGREPLYQASAINGEGVLDTFYGLMTILIDNLNTNYSFENNFHVRAEDILKGVFGDYVPTKQPLDKAKGGLK